MAKYNELITLHIILEIFVVIGYFQGHSFFGYLFSFWYVIPLTAINFFLSLLDSPSTLKYDGLNFIISILALVPIIGIIPRIVGMILAILAILKLK